MPAEPRLSVLLVSPESVGGIGRHVHMLAAGLIERQVQVTVCAPAETLERFDFAATGARVFAAPVGSMRDAAAVVRGRTAAALRVLAAEHDLTHAHGVRAGAAAAMSGARPLVATWHNAPIGAPWRRQVHRALERYGARRSALVLGASADLVERARSAGAPQVRLCEVAAPPLPTRAVRPSPELHDPPRIVTIARLHAQKRLDLLIDVAAGWPAGAGRPELLIAGDGPLAAQLARRIAACGAPVRLLGERADIADLLGEADVVALSSDWEARPLVAQEALRAGVPLVATDVGGVRDLVGDAAVLVPPGSAEELAGGIRRVLQDEALRARLRVAGPAQAATWPTVDEMVDRLLDDYLDLRSRLSPGGP